jgi:hypothetical protein
MGIMDRNACDRRELSMLGWRCVDSSSRGSSNSGGDIKRVKARVTVVFIFLCICNMFLCVKSECANACNGHGKCTSYDMCICYRNWQAGDCSERKFYHFTICAYTCTCWTYF